MMRKIRYTINEVDFTCDDAFSITRVDHFCAEKYLLTNVAIGLCNALALCFSAWMRLRLDTSSARKWAQIGVQKTKKRQRALLQCASSRSLRLDEGREKTNDWMSNETKRESWLTWEKLQSKRVLKASGEACIPFQPCDSKMFYLLSARDRVARLHL